MANRRMLLKAIETVRRRHAADGAGGRSRSGRDRPDTIDCIAPAAGLGGLGRRGRRPSATAPGWLQPCRRRPPVPERIRLASAAACTTPRARRPALCCCNACAKTGIEQVRIGLVRPARPAAQQDPDAGRAGRRAAGRRRHGQHAAAEGHLRPHRLQGLRARRLQAHCRAAGFGAPTTCCCCRTRPASCRCPGRRARPGCGPALVRRRHPVPAWTRAVCCSGAGTAAAPGDGPALRARGRVPHLPHRRRRAGPDAAAWPAEPPAVRADPPRLQPAGRGMPTWPTSRWPSCAHGAGPGPAAAVAGDRTRPEPGRGGVRRRPTR
jgi:hypothetical protein